MPGLFFKNSSGDYVEDHDDDSNYDSDDKKFDVKNFHADVAGLDVEDGGYYNRDNDGLSNKNFDVREFHGDDVGLDKGDDYDNRDDEDLNGMRFHGASKNCERVCDHCHYTGKYRAVAHSTCNLRYKRPKEILVVFQNGPNYDYHFIIKQLGKEFEE